WAAGRPPRPGAAQRRPGQFGPGDIYARLPPVDDRGEDQVAKFLLWNPDPVGRHAAQVAALDPRLAAVVRRIEAESPELRFVVGSGRRSFAEQKQAEAWGWAPPRRAATAESYGGGSHGRHVRGEAVDLWPLDSEGRVIFDPAAQRRLAQAAKRAAAALGVGLLWGGDFPGRKDPPHFELTARSGRAPQR
ncbi:M15 family metallopeptidase, partial [Enterovirga sp.]|uniref:M15 family metallopeptidase n=1 Tax=Enterovirga sp. TaxID=2026350 RepID=UPI00261D8ED7